MGENMAFNDADQLVEQLSCDFILADPVSEPKSLSALLPILKALHGNLKQDSKDEEAGQVLKIKNKIQTILKSPSDNPEKKMEQLGDMVMALSFSLNQQMETEIEHHHVDDDSLEEEPLSEPVLNLDIFKKLKIQIKELNCLVAQLCPGELPDLGALITNLQQMVEMSKDLKPNLFNTIAKACQDYTEHITLEEIYNTKPIEEGSILLKSILYHLKKNEEFVFDYSDVMTLLDMNFEPPTEFIKEEPEPDILPEFEAMEKQETPDTEPIVSGEPDRISDDDLEILTDFVAEAIENLDTIEVSLIDLEQDPTNLDIINDIFRPFHTIKGVSGFLSLTKINTLAHTTENLLDSARSGDFVIEHSATDAILESVDMLKALIGRIEQGISTGFLPPDDDINAESLRHKLKNLQISLSKGEKEPLGEILIQKEIINKETLDNALESQQVEPEKKIGEILVEKEKVKPEQVASALMEQNKVKKKLDSQVKVSTRKLDDLVDYTGELVIAQSMLRQKTANDPELNQTVSQLGQIVNNMQNISMSMRMIPIKATFMKMIRLVRDLAKKSGKNVSLNMSGEDTEIDRNVVDALYEPMVHMIRNSVDHGIELKDDRLAAGKPEQGTINLNAFHKGGHIQIEIKDDGKGLDKDRILDKAISTGLTTGTEQLTDSQIYELIMQPGFSTAQKITDVSGRGVGMDVVKDGIEKFRGHLGIESEKGIGTKFTISLPLTLAIIDGMLVRVNGERYVIPTISIQKAFKPGDNEYFTVEGKGEMVKDRGKLIPLIRLDEMYTDKHERIPIQDGLVVVVESKDECRALLIDELLGKDEFVIKSLGNNLRGIEGLAGGAILADGRVGLILDIHGIFSIVTNS